MSVVALAVFGFLMLEPFVVGDSSYILARDFRVVFEDQGRAIDVVLLRAFIAATALAGAVTAALVPYLIRRRGRARLAYLIGWAVWIVAPTFLIALSGPSPYARR